MFPLALDASVAYRDDQFSRNPRAMNTRTPVAATMDAFLRDVSRRARLTAELATRDRDAAQDIVQEAMLTLYTKYSGHDPASWAPLFHRILHSRLMDHFRRETRRRKWVTRLEPFDDDVEDDPIQHIPEVNDSNPVTLLQRADNMDVVMAAVEALPLRQKQAFLLRAWEGFDTAQTADIMGCAEGSVKTHYFRALTAIKAKLGDVGTHAEDLT